MRVTVDNLDGLGAREYTGVIPAKAKGGSSLRIERGLNVPSRCEFAVVAGAGGLPVPARRARVVVSAANGSAADGTSTDGTVLFTGYLATEPVPVYAGERRDGVVYQALCSAVSDEWLLDKLGPPVRAGDGFGLGLDAREVLVRLLNDVGGGVTPLEIADGSAVGTIGAFGVDATATWSVNAGGAAGAAYAGYRAVGGQVVLQMAGAVTHELRSAHGAAGILKFAELKAGNVRELANDVTLSGEEEAAAYVSEVFLGDGSTAAFALSGAAFHGNNRMLVEDRFDGATVDATQWVVSDPGSHLSLSSAGLVMNGGDGVDGDTTLTALDAVEMAGSVVVEMTGVELESASDGMLGGMYSGPTVLASCVAGFRVRQSSGVTVMTPVVLGLEVGELFTMTDGHKYTLRLRLHCAEMQRVMGRYRCMVDGVVQTFGSAAGVDAPMDVTFEVVDEGVASNTPATVLYDSATAGAAIAASPATCVFAAVNSARLFGSVRRVAVTRPGSMWVVSTLPDGTRQTRLMGVAGEGADCVVSYGSAGGEDGKVTFFDGRVPVPNERITVSYRGQRRAVARVADAASVAAEAATGVPGTSRWLGKVLQPAARSSADCESAAGAVLLFASSRSAALAGTYAVVNPGEDVWPGDLLQVAGEQLDWASGASATTALLVRSVVIEDGGAEPEVKRYKIAFANDWAAELADGLGVRLSEAVAPDAVLPVAAGAAVLANLHALQVTSVSETVLQVDAGAVPPPGGGFEVRRRDWVFGVADDADLVMRSPVRSFAIPRVAAVERFYVRMYDASVPPVCSRFSSAVVLDVPVG